MSTKPNYDTDIKVTYEWRKENGKMLYAKVTRVTLYDEQSHTTSSRLISEILEDQPDYHEYLMQQYIQHKHNNIHNE